MQILPEVRINQWGLQAKLTKYIGLKHLGPDDQAFNWFFMLHNKSLCYFASRLLQDELQAEEIVSDCFIKLWERQQNFETADNIKAFLYKAKAAWLKAVKNDAMPWVQVSDLKGFKSEIAVKYGIAAIPQNFLINPAGVIIAKDLRGEDVNEKIASFIK